MVSKCNIGVNVWSIVALIANCSSTLSHTIELRGLAGPEGSRRSRLPDFKTIGT